MTKRRCRIIGLAAAIALIVGVLVPAAAHAAPAPIGAATPEHKLLDVASRILSGRRAPAGERAGALHAASVLNPVSARMDHLGDVDGVGADLSAVGAKLTAATLRVSATLPKGKDPKADRNWREGETGLLWSLDLGADGIVDKYLLLIALPTGSLFGAVIPSVAGASSVSCLGNATYEATGRISVQIASGCVGSPDKIAVGVEMDYDRFPDLDGLQGDQDWAPDLGLVGPITVSAGAPSVVGALEVDAHGSLAAVAIGGVKRAPGVWAPFGNAVARGVATTPDGGTGYVVDGTGLLHPFGVGRNGASLRTFGVARWAGQDVARGVAIRPNGNAGLVVDRYGGLHPFGIGGSRVVPKLFGVAKWPGVDMARGVAVLPNGLGGYTLDAFGGLHWFSIGAARAAPKLFGVASFPRQDRARGVTILPDRSGGFVVDSAGALHWFSIGTQKAAPAVAGAPSWPGTARGVAVLTGLVALPKDPVDPLVKIDGAVTDVVVDPAGKLAYATESFYNRVVVIDLAARKQIAAIPVGTRPTSLDLTPDGTKLYVASRAGISVISVASRSVLRTIPVAPAPDKADFPFSIAIAANGTALVSTSYEDVDGGARVLQLTLATDALTTRINDGVLSDTTFVEPSGDRSRVVFLEGNVSVGTAYVYYAESDQITSRLLGQRLVHPVMNDDGTMILVDGFARYDADLNLLGDLPPGGKGGAFSADGQVIYRTNGSTLDFIDAATLETLESRDIGNSVEQLFSGAVTVTPDGNRVVVITDFGLSIIDL
jgi:YVTN family beta-propeller protein